MQRAILGLLLLAVGATAQGLRADEPAWSSEKKNHWAWKPPVRPAAPAVRRAGWVRNPIDAFILARLEAAGLAPAAPAPRAQLLRRVTFDLIGLPPTPEEIDAFVQDATAGAWEKVVDRLLASPHYGERWGRHWLDLARFAESNGYEYDEVRPNAWRYRDYVIASFHADKPYDRFLQEQLAGDELAPGDPQAVIATGFNLLGPDMTDASNQAQRRQNTLDDMTDTAGLVFLGLTVGCARCHHHKFEPISQKDYFRLQAFFAPAEYQREKIVADDLQKNSYEASQRAYQERTGKVRANLQVLEAPYRRQLYEKRLARLSEAARAAHQTPAPQRTLAQKELAAGTARLLAVSDREVEAALAREDRRQQERLQQELQAHEKYRPAPLPTALALGENGKTVQTFVLRRGEWNHRGEEVQPGWPTILTPGFRTEPALLAAPSPRTSGRRRALAAWMTRADHPLTARVMVNRVWQHHFGRGLVATPSDFGLRGQLPTHPELLDWLACEFAARGWSLKQMHRLMLLSATYQQAATATPEALAQDRENHLCGRMRRQRLEGEILRDSLLAVSGLLNRKIGGPSVLPPLPPEVASGAAASTGGRAWKASADPADHVRRSVYILVRRNLRFPFLEPFDVPDSNQSCPQRERSTTAPQALALLNASDVSGAAQALARLLAKEADTTDERISRAYRRALGRVPTQTEQRLSRAFLAEAPLSELCRALFNVNEFIYLD